MGFNHDAFVERIDLFRKKIKSTGVDIESVKGLSPASISSYKQRKNLPKGDSLEEWGRCFGLNVNWLLLGEGPMFRSAPAGNGDQADARLRDLEERVRELKYTVELQRQMLESRETGFLRDASAVGIPSAAPLSHRATDMKEGESL